MQSNVMINKNIKKIAKAVKIDTIITKVNYSGKKRVQRTVPKYKLIGTHTARKTFISLSLQKGMRPEQLKAITGHTSVQQMTPYIGNDKDKLSNDLKETEEKLFSRLELVRTENKYDIDNHLYRYAHLMRDCEKCLCRELYIRLRKREALDSQYFQTDGIENRMDSFKVVIG